MGWWIGRIGRRRCPHQMPAAVEATLLELRRSRPYWGPRRLVFELAKRRVVPVPSESAVYRALVRAGMIDPSCAGSALAQVETLGTRRADGAVADGRRGRVPAGGWDQRQSVDRDR